MNCRFSARVTAFAAAAVAAVSLLAACSSSGASSDSGSQIVKAIVSAEPVMASMTEEAKLYATIDGTWHSDETGMTLIFGSPSVTIEDQKVSLAGNEAIMSWDTNRAIVAFSTSGTSNTLTGTVTLAYAPGIKIKMRDVVGFTFDGKSATLNPVGSLNPIEDLVWTGPGH